MKLLKIILIFTLVFVSSDLTFAQGEKKSVGKAFLYSLALPGLGQKYVGDLGLGKVSIAAEAVMTVMALRNKLQGDWMRQDYEAYAAEHAGVDVNNKNKSFFVAIEKYETIYLYNEKMRIEARFDNRIPETYSNIWVWDSREHMLDYRAMRVDADIVKNKVSFYISSLFINHMASAIHAVIVAKNHNRKIEAGNTNSSSVFSKITSDVNPVNPRRLLNFRFQF